jgi:multidrug efflux pump subunit AcrA (membrane-fusion protein)
MVARAEIEFERLQNVPLLPQDAVVERSGEMVVFAIADNVAKRRTPKLGAKQNGFYPIREGLQPGEIVVVAGQAGLTDGAPVEIQP